MPANPNEIARLRKLMADVSKKSKKQVAKPKGKSMALRGSRGTGFAEKKRFDLLNISLNNKNPNQKLASDVIKILDKARASLIEAPSGSPSSDHQILTNIVNSILKANNERRVAKLNPNQLRVLEKYLEL